MACADCNKAYRKGRRKALKEAKEDKEYYYRVVNVRSIFAGFVIAFLLAALVLVNPPCSTKCRQVNCLENNNDYFINTSTSNYDDISIIDPFKWNCYSEEVLRCYIINGTDYKDFTQKSIPVTELVNYHNCSLIGRSNCEWIK